jgi:hypothetical protein
MTEDSIRPARRILPALSTGLLTIEAGVERVVCHTGGASMTWWSLPDYKSSYEGQGRTGSGDEQQFRPVFTQDDRSEPVKIVQMLDNL